MDTRTALSPGTVLPFPGMLCTLGEEIGRGSNAIVYRGAYPDLLNKNEKHTVLIKELFPFHAKGVISRGEDGNIVCLEEALNVWRTHRDSFEYGNRIHLRMLQSHPELTGANLNSFSLNGTLYTVLGYTGGRSLAQELSRQETDLRRLTVRMLKLLDALDAFHGEGYLHLDIAPDNILLIGEGGGELVKQLLQDTYDVAYPGVVAIYLTGKPAPYVGPHDIALAIVKAVFEKGYVKNKVMEFVGPGVSTMTTDYRNGVDVMTTETTCLSSVWRTDTDTRSFLAEHGRADDYKELNPADVTYYDGCVEIDLSKIKPMIAMPFHPSNAYTIDELYANLNDILEDTEQRAAKVAGGRASFTFKDKITPDGKLMVQQGVIGGCAGGNYTNVVEAAHALKGKTCGFDEFYLSVYPSSQPVFVDLDRKGFLADLMDAGAVIRTAFCGPCFGAGDTPANNAFSIRHTTRNFPNREGSKPGNGQMSAVALMDARSIAATAANGGKLTSAEELDCWGDIPAYRYDDKAYKSRVYWGFGKATPESDIRFGPNIKDWPEQEALADNILLKVVSKILDEVTTTDELIPSGETSSYRSNPLGLAEFTLSRRDPQYVGRAKEVQKVEYARLKGEDPAKGELAEVYAAIKTIPGQAGVNSMDIEYGSTIYANKPGDGSAREQAASCQRVLGALANITQEYATKRYRSNCMNWGMIPFHLKGEPNFEVGDYVYVPGIRKALDDNKLDSIKAYVIKGGKAEEVELYIQPMTDNERTIVKAGCLINFNRNRAK